MSGMVKSWLRLTKFALIVAPNRWNQWNIGSTVVHWLNMGGNTLPTSFGNSLPKRRISARGSLFLWCNVCLINLCVIHSNGLVTSDSFLEAVFRGLTSVNEMIWFSTICNGTLREHVKSFGTPCNIVVGLSANKLLGIWKRPTRTSLKNLIWLGGPRILLWPRVN